MSMSKPFNTCEFCGRVCEFRKLAMEVTTSQPEFVQRAIELIKNENIKDVVAKALEKAAIKLDENINPLSMSQRALAYCIMANIVVDLPISQDNEKTSILMKEIKKNLVIMLKNVANIAEAVSVLQEEEEEKVSQEELRKKRELLRAQTKKAEAEESIQEGEPISIADAILNWIRSDVKFMKIVKKLSKTTGGILIQYDPESEGYLSSLKIQYAQKTFNFGDEIIPVTKMRILAKYDIKYGHDVAIGYGGPKGKNIVAAYFFGGLPKEEEDIKAALRDVNLKDVSELDRLTLILNGDKKLRKNISKLPLKSPLPQKIDNIDVPITIRSRGDIVQIICTCFFNEKIKPYSIFIAVVERLAEDIDNLAEFDEKVRTKTAAETSLFEVEETNYTPHEFHFLSNTPSTLEVKTCPNCGRPFPDPEAEYRRCPYCLFKLM
ncbi:MAG: hypothetical protein ACTSRZ_17145 [Promethearchaeota archaeon]